MHVVAAEALRVGEAERGREQAGLQAHRARERSARFAGLRRRSAPPTAGRAGRLVRPGAARRLPGARALPAAQARRR